MLLLFVFYQNITSLKKLIHRKKNYNKSKAEYFRTLEDGKKKFGDGITVGVVSLSFIVISISITFYLLAGTILDDNKLFLIWSVFMVVVNIRNFIKTTKHITNGTFPKRTWYEDLIVVINTIYLIYFTFQYVILT